MDTLRRELRLRDLVFFNICSLVSLRWTSSAAHSGSGSLLLWVAGAVLFFLPSALVVAKLSRLLPEQGGIYSWTKSAFGDRHAFLCGWFYFNANVLYFPSLVMAGIGMAGFALGGAARAAGEDRTIAIPVTLAILWSAFIVNFFGLRVAKWITAIGGSASFIVGAAIVILAALGSRSFGSATRFRLLPQADLYTLNFWPQIAFAFVGLELAPIVSGEIRNPDRDLPRAARIAGVVTALFYVSVTAALLVLLPPEEISPMLGLAQACVAGAEKLGIPGLGVLLGALMGFSLIGQLDAWVAGNTRLPYAVGLDHYLPAAFHRIHPRWGTPHISLLMQAMAATTFLLMAQLGENVMAAYQIMVDMMVIVTFLPFLYMFGAGFRFGSRLPAVSGLAVTILAMALAAVPPPGVASVPVFELKVVGGSILFAFAGLMIFGRYERIKRTQCPLLGQPQQPS